MKFLITPFCILFSLSLFTSCQERTSQMLTDENFQNEHTSQNSLDWNGTYTGQIKGLENENFSISLSLEVDGVYFIELNDGQRTIVKRNKFNWSSDGRVIELYDVNEILNKFFVGENYLIQLDAKGQKPENFSDYQLNKIVADEM